MISKVLAVVMTALVASPAMAVQVDWVDWQTRSGTSVSGQMQVGGQTIGVDFSTTAPAIWDVQLGGAGDIDFWTEAGTTRTPGTSPYTSTGTNGNSNIPTGTDIIELSSAGTHTFTFDQAVSGIYLSFATLNSNSLTFTTEIQLLSSSRQNADGAGVDDAGFWGQGLPSVTTGAGTWTLDGQIGENHGTLFLPGSFSAISFVGGSEAWHGVTIGVAGVSASVPLPATGLLFLGGLGGLISLRRKQSA